VGSITSAERGSLITVVVCMSVGGTYAPPTLIFPRKNFSEQLVRVLLQERYFTAFLQAG
jgi:hypothetical protein